jgi:inorganic pyrophosphatase
VNLVQRIPLHAANGAGDARGAERGSIFHVVVETPRHARVKLKYDETLDGFVWSRPLTLGVQYPYDFGFFPRTQAEDGDPLDALVYTEQPSYPGVIVPARVIGALRVEQRRKGTRVKRNDRVVVVPVDEKRRSDIADVRELPARVLEELEEFFRASIVLTGKVVRYRGWAGAPETRKIVLQAAKKFLGATTRPPGGTTRGAPARTGLAR